MLYQKATLMKQKLSVTMNKIVVAISRSRNLSHCVQSCLRGYPNNVFGCTQINYNIYICGLSALRKTRHATQQLPINMR